MFAIIGMIIVFASIIMGFTMAGGKVPTLIQIPEFIVIGGCALGSVLVAFGPKGAVSVLTTALSLIKGNPYKKQVFLDLLQAMYEVFTTARKEGILELEKHSEEPHESTIFKKYPSLLNNHHALEMLADTLKLVAMGGITIYALQDMMEIDIEAHHEEAMKTPGILTTLADAMPGFGIVAAVLGVVVTMGAVGGPPAVIGEKVAAALVGTFLGILLAYGVFAPLAKACETILACEAQYLACIKNAVIAFARGDVPLVCVEFARRNIEPELRPTFGEMERTVKGLVVVDGGAGKADAEKAG
ncbi:MAG: flagellar motor stator protein MotA [Armatimonadota bacterium]